MKLYNYWVRHSGKLVIDGQPVDATFYGKSNTSEDDAHRDATNKESAVQRRIDQGNTANRESYDVPIREEIVTRLDGRNVVTRNRYGAMVLNSEDLLFVDIDHPRFGFFRKLFRKPKGTVKEQIVEMVMEKASKSEYRNIGIRIYETRKGVRLIIQGIQSLPVDGKVMALMADFNADDLYATLCIKQQCYRARLTPKPSRIKCKTPRVPFPRSEAEQKNLDMWIEDYNKCAAGFAVCKHIRDIGRFRENTAVRFHDSQTNSTEALPLA